MPSSPPATKFAVVIGDGMADYELPKLQGKTPLEAARTPNMDRIASVRSGVVRTIPEGAEPGSDVANLSLLGYDPLRCRTRRGPFEAASMGVRLAPQEVAFRMNLVSLDHRSETEIRMLSHSAGDLSTPEGRELVAALQDSLKFPGIRLYPGVAYRHLLVWDKGPEETEAIPPHDVLGRNMAPYLANGENNPLVALTRQSWPILHSHPLNATRRGKGLPEANSIWLWGQGRAPRLTPFRERFGLQGGVVCAVDLIKGIGVYAGFEPIPVQGATGYLDTNYAGKGREALRALERLDLVYVHVEAPDEAGHAGSAAEKIQAIESFDHHVVGTLLEGMEIFDDFKVLVASDHLTPIVRRTHTTEPAPFAWASKAELRSAGRSIKFCERNANGSGLSFERGQELMPAFLSS